MIDVEAYRPVFTNLIMGMIFLIWFKTMLGFHFSWEKCDCCGKKWKDIRRKNAASNDNQ